ncbi:MAG: hypothetical protein AB1679_36495 [Actinomycetota bacterium]
MKPITIHPASAVVGAILVAVPFLVASFQTQAWPRQVPFPVSVQEMPDPHDMVVIRQEDGAYTVPEGKLFVLTGLGQGQWTYNAAQVYLFIDGVSEVAFTYSFGGGTGGAEGMPSVIGVPAGCAVPAGRAIRVLGSICLAGS